MAYASTRWPMTWTTSRPKWWRRTWESRSMPSHFETPLQHRDHRLDGTGLADLAGGGDAVAGEAAPGLLEALLSHGPRPRVGVGETEAAVVLRDQEMEGAAVGRAFQQRIQELGAPERPVGDDEVSRHGASLQ
jgi:hypothetical protein